MKSYKQFGHFKLVAIVLSLGSVALIWATIAGAGHRQIALLLPDVRPDHKEQYLCVAHKLPVSSQSQYIVGFTPKGNSDRVHHMLMFGCSLPGVQKRDSPSYVWDCGEMHSADSSNELGTYEQAPVCRGNQHVLYGWALDAPSLKLPRDMGLKVGGMASDIKYLVLQVHYGHFKVFQQQPDLTDNSGLLLDMKPDEPASGIARQAGVLLLISYGKVPTGKSRHEIWCDIEDDIEIHPFRFRVHTHKLGTKVLGAKLGSKEKTQDGFGNLEVEDNHIIGVGDPQKPQMFYPVREENLTIRKGDSVYAYCEFNNNQTHSVNIGPTANDEMCNYYLMYWTYNERLLSKSNCFGANPRSLIQYALWK